MTLKNHLCRLRENKDINSSILNKCLTKIGDLHCNVKRQR